MHELSGKNATGGTGKKRERENGVLRMMTRRRAWKNVDLSGLFFLSPSLFRTGLLFDLWMSKQGRAWIIFVCGSWEEFPARQRDCNQNTNGNTSLYQEGGIPFSSSHRFVLENAKERWTMCCDLHCLIARPARFRSFVDGRGNFSSPLGWLLECFRKRDGKTTKKMCWKRLRFLAQREWFQLSHFSVSTNGNCRIENVLLVCFFATRRSRWEQYEKTETI